jgi:hypothetical protein
MLAFNGTRFRQILPAEPGLRTVTSVLVLGSGRVPIGTERQGLLLFDGRRLTPFHPRLKTDYITAPALPPASLPKLPRYRIGWKRAWMRRARPPPPRLSSASGRHALHRNLPLATLKPA